VSTATAGAIEPTAVDNVSAAVTALFVPGNRPERFGKAAQARAGVVIIDLEDAVPQDAKASALNSVVTALSPAPQRGGIQALVRVNAADSKYWDEETAALLRLAKVSGHGLLGIVVPKAEDPAVLLALRERLPVELALVPLIESAAGMVNALELARVAGVTRLAFGAIDYALDINAGDGDRFLDQARSHLVLCSRAAGIAAPLDSPCTAIEDTKSVTDSASLARSFGFGGKLCIHPVQLPAVQHAFAPTPAEIEWAQLVIVAQGGAAQVAGQMIDRPVTERAKRILLLARKEQ
jgi:citrate lyase subunit beta/citryl-CoA lyase